jgi:hypothetical protein
MRCHQAATAAAAAFIFIVVIVATTTTALLLPPLRCRRHSAMALQGWSVILVVGWSVEAQTKQCGGGGGGRMNPCSILTSLRRQRGEVMRQIV